MSKYNFIYRYNWNVVTSAVWRKYPNHILSHVLGAHILNRYIDTEGNLRTTRLMETVSPVPEWVTKVKNAILTVYWYINEKFFWRGINS